MGSNGQQKAHRLTFIDEETEVPISITGTGLEAPCDWSRSPALLLVIGRPVWCEICGTAASTRAELVNLTGWSSPLSPVPFRFTLG